MAVAIENIHHMFESRVGYSYISSDQAFIFFHIEKDDPTTLRYHDTVSSAEINDDELGFSWWKTATI